MVLRQCSPSASCLTVMMRRHLTRSLGQVLSLSRKPCSPQTCAWPICEQLELCTSSHVPVQLHSALQPAERMEVA